LTRLLKWNFGSEERPSCPRKETIPRLKKVEFQKGAKGVRV
jgi:hypothetical protein